MTQPNLIHMRSAVLGGQLVTAAMRGAPSPADTIETLIMQQLGTHKLTRTDVDLSMCGPKAQNAADVRRIYALKIMECLLVRGSDPSLMTDSSLEGIMRKAWKMARVMEEEDFVGQQLATLAKDPEGG